MRAVWLWLLGMLLAGQVLAVGQRDVTVTLQQYRVQSGGAVVALTAGERVKPGDVIEYRVVYHNVSQRVVHQVTATLPVPDDTEWVAGSAVPMAQEASVDGKSFAALPLRRQVVLPSGQRVWRDVPLKEYRGLRWHLGDLAAGQQTTVVARVRLGTLTPLETIRR